MRERPREILKESEASKAKKKRITRETTDRKLQMYY